MYLLANATRPNVVHFDVGKTAVFGEHLAATVFFTPFLCTHRKKERCRWLYNYTVFEARRQGFDSLQFLNHTMDRTNVKQTPRQEIVDLRLPHRPLGTVWSHFFGQGEVGGPCLASQHDSWVVCNAPSAHAKGTK